MKFNVEVDCTPEEARRFIGLPDLSRVHDAYVERMTKAVAEGPTADNFAEMLRSWAPMGEAGPAMWKSMFEGMAGAPSKR